jgi:hypothetical protein
MAELPEVFIGLANIHQPRGTGVLAQLLWFNIAIAICVGNSLVKE